jgi:predicted dehydrogenase
LERVRLGFAGVGWLGESLIKQLPRFPELQLVAVQDVNAELAADVAARHRAEWHGTDYQALIARRDLDGVVICTPNALHAQQARAALRVGKHVLVQKPLALSPRDAEATVHLAAQIGKLLFVDYSYRYLETVGALRRALLRIGRPRRVVGTFHNTYGPGKAWFFDPELSGGGALVDLGVHLLDLALELLEPDAAQLVDADLSFARGHRVEDAARLVLRLDGVPFELEVSWNAERPLTEISLQVDGEGGYARWENVGGSFFRFRTVRDGECLLDRETTLREDTLRTFREALARGVAPPVPTRVYELLARAYS